jgi:hypothetical protein
MVQLKKFLKCSQEVSLKKVKVPMEVMVHLSPSSTERYIILLALPTKARIFVFRFIAEYIVA